MPSNKPIFTFRTDKEILQKLHVIAKQEERTDNKQLEYIVKSYIKTYEQKHGIINCSKLEQ